MSPSPPKPTAAVPPFGWMPNVIAHRGASTQAPENTLAAFARAAAIGARAVEMDVTVSRDGVAVIVHDLDVDRCSDGRGAVVEKTLAELQALDAGSWFSPAFAGERIPTLKAVLEALPAHGLALNLELKPTPGWEAATVAATVGDLQSYWPDGAPLLVSSMNTRALALFHGRMPSVALGLITEEVPENAVAELAAHACVCLHCDHHFIDAQVVEQLHATSRRVHVYTVNEEIRARELFAMRVDAIFTDVPERMLPIADGSPPTRTPPKP